MRGRRREFLTTAAAWLLAPLAVLCPAACERRPAAATPGPSTAKPPGESRPTKADPTIASLSPAATDLLLGMGAGEHLVAVSNYDVEREGVAGLPRVGDYRSIDWEKLAELKPQVLVIQMRAERVPAGLSERAGELGAALVNVQIDDLADVYKALPQLGAAAREPEKAAAAGRRLREQFDAVRQRVAAAPKVPALIVVDDGGRSVAGPKTFLDDVLGAAGGANAAAALNNPWPSIDREKFAALAPEVIIQLLPDASAQVVNQAKRFWASMPELPAVRNERVHILTDWYVLQPGFQLGTLAEQFAQILHPRTDGASSGEARAATKTPAGRDGP